MLPVIELSVMSRANSSLKRQTTHLIFPASPMTAINTCTPVRAHH